jgi:hypothetical protein
MTKTMASGMCPYRLCDRAVRQAHPFRAFTPTCIRPAETVDVFTMLRLRERPPIGHWLFYRWVGGQLPWKYRWWARDDIRGRFFFERHIAFTMFCTSLWMTLGQVLTSHVTHLLFLGLLGASVVVYLLLLPAKSQFKRRWLAKHEFHPDGTSYVPIPPEARPGG